MQDLSDRQARVDIRWVAGLQLFHPDVRVFIDRECEGGLYTTDQRVQPFLRDGGFAYGKCQVFALWKSETVEVNLSAGESHVQVRLL